VAYLERAIEQLERVSQRVAALRAGTTLEPLVGRRLDKLADAIDGARSSLAVGLGIRRFLLARGTSRAAPAAAGARAAHDRFAALQTPERMIAGTLWTGRWRRDETFAEWEREASTAPG
jgi:hypothetical protein